MQAGLVEAAGAGADERLSGAKAAPVPRKGLRALCAAATFAAVIACASAFLAALQLPTPGTWTGIVPLERKVDRLERFAERGPVDALVLGSSIADSGFSARLFSQLMSRRLGREYRAFNFGVGGAEPRTLPKLYRIARTVAKPRSVFVVAPPEPRLAEAISGAGPDHALDASPAGAVLDDEWLLRASRAAWSSPLIAFAPILRELVRTGASSSFSVALGADAVPMDANGDRVSFAVVRDLARLPVYRRDLQASVAPLPSGSASTPRQFEHAVRRYFSARDAAALAELGALVRRDGGELHVLSHASAAALWDAGERLDSRYEQGRENYFRVLAAALGATFHDAARDLRVPLFALADTIHLNDYGARIYTRAAFAAFTGGDAPGSTAVDLPAVDVLASADPTFNAQSALVRRAAGESGTFLRIRLVDTFAVPALPKGAIDAVVRLPDGTDRIATARRTAEGELVARLDLPATTRPEAMMLRLLPHGARAALPNPIAAYEWCATEPRALAAPAAAPPARRAAYWVLRLFMGAKAPRSLLERPMAGVRDASA